MFCFSAILIIIFDRLTKAAVASRMVLNTSIVVLPKLLSFTYILNSGAAYGILEGKKFFLVGLTAAAIIAIIVYVAIKRKSVIALERLSLGLIVGGGIGNLIDRIANGCVVDFIDIHIMPVFNVADIGVTIGSILLIITVLFLEKDNKSE